MASDDHRRMFDQPRDVEEGEDSENDARDA
jgi:hypothetical protein